MSTKQKTRSAAKQQPALKNSSELSDVELERVNGGIIAILIGKSSTSSQGVSPTFVQPGPTT
jgi:hypothetical protein